MGALCRFLRSVFRARPLLVWAAVALTAFAYWLTVWAVLKP